MTLESHRTLGVGAAICVTSVGNMKRTAIASLVLIAALGLAGCAPSGAADQAAPDAGKGMPQEAYDSDGGTGSLADEPAQDSARSEIVTGLMTVTVEEPLDAATEAVRIVQAAGGRIDGRQEYAPVDGDKGSANLVLRIPSDNLDAVIAKLKKLGEVEQVSTTGVDVTSQVKDIDSRVKSLQASVDRLTTLLATAKDVETLVAIESSLTQRQSDLESMLAQQRSIGDQVSLATITLELISEADAPIDPPVNFLTGLGTGWTSFVAFVSGTVVVIGVLLPWLAFFGILTAVIVLVVRWRQRVAAGRTVE